MARPLLKNNGPEHEFQAALPDFDRHNVENGLSSAPVMIAAAAPVFNPSGVAEIRMAGKGGIQAVSPATAITDTSRDLTGHGAGTTATTLGEPDIYDSWSTTTGTITINHSVSSAIDSDGDTDWFAFNVNAGYIYTFDLAGTGSMALSDPLLKLYDAYGNLIAFDDDSGPGINAHLSYYADTTGVLYISAEAFPNTAPYDNTGYYTLTMGPRTLATEDTVGSTVWDHGNLTVGTRISGRIDRPGDHDWYAVDLTAGQGYDFDITGLNGLDTFIRVYDSSGNLIAQNDDTHTGLDAHLDFEPFFDGTYYISAETSGDQSYGDYSIKVSNGARPLLTDAIDWGTKLNVTGGVVKVYFAASGEVFDGQTSHGWSDHEIAQAMAALGVYSNYINLTFVQTSNASEAQFKLVTSTDLDDDVLAYMNPPGTANAGVGVFAIDTPAWTGTFGSDPLMPGGLGFETLLHELGHGLGLSHPFDGGGNSPIMTGVLDTYDYWGYGYQNQGVYTIMSYNDGWPGNSEIPMQDNYSHGWGETPMAIDIAALQAKYGANATYHNGDDVYELTANSSRQTSFWSIWDTGGTDTISAENEVYNGAVIDLRAATMNYSPYTETAGGDPSYVRYQNGAITIAQGVIIENATGSRQGDTIIGNDYANVIKGMGGSDAISARGGNDSIFLTVSDGYGNSAVDGGDGIDTLTVDMSHSAFTGIYDGNSLTMYGGGYAITVMNVETIVFTDGAYAFNKVINVAPVLSGTFTSSINGGGQRVLTIADLGVSDFNGDSLTFYVQAENKHGTTDYSGATVHGSITVNGVAANTFTSSQLAAGQVRFVQDGTADVPVSFKVAAYDGQAWSQTINFSFVAAYNHGSYLFVAGTANNDTLSLANFSGGVGNDVLAGFVGDDTYIIDKPNIVVMEGANDGWDTVRASVSYVMANNLETLYLTGSANINGSGNAQDNVLFGNDGNNKLDGKAGADEMWGGAGNDTYYVDNFSDSVWEWLGPASMGDAGGIDTVISSVDWTAGYYIENVTLTGNAISATGNNLDNILTGNASNNILTGDWGNDTLNGGLGADTMYGGMGDDTYIVDNIGDKVIEDDTYGSDAGDTVIASISYTLGANIENLFLSGSANINAAGNNLNNLLVGNDGNNVLNGGAGADTMNGGNGDDVYYVDNAGDVVIEGSTGGNDTIYSSITYSLNGKYVENLFLSGSANINAAGNNLNNLLVGNDGNNVLNGGAGADTMNGGNGDDVYYVDNAGDVVIEGSTGGNDTIISSLTWSLSGSYVENLILSGSDNINASGNNLANHLTGNTGNNVLNGGAGNDILTGGGGNDIFWFGAGSGQDTIADFSGDTINLNAYSHGVANGGGIVISQVGGNTVIDLGGGNIITLTGIVPADLTGHIVW